VVDVLFPGILAAAIAALTTSLVVPPVIRIATSLQAVDTPGGRRQHEGAVPRLGGVAIAVGLLFGGGSVGLMKWGQWGERVARADLAALLLAVALVFLVGVVDDTVGASVLHKFLVECAAAVLVVGVGWGFTEFGVPGLTVQLGPLGWVVSVLWVVGVTNAINLIDGLDGLAAGVVAIMAVGLFVYATWRQHFFTAVLMAAIAGACLGFLRHNWAPARIFLGDGGSLPLGFLLAVMAMHSSLKGPAAVAILVPIVTLGVPVIDTLLVMVLRFAAEPRSSLATRVLRMFRADRAHLHYLLEAMAGSRARVVRWIYGAVLLSCLGALAVALTKSAELGLALVAAQLAGVLVLRRLGWVRLAEAISTERRAALRRVLAPDSASPEAKG
jgi:UDP-GlcNAc:undecaprenyl-phosphate GlcNAc-1-phosphate transferase